MVKVNCAPTPPLPPSTPLPPAAPLRENCADTAPTGAVDALYPQPKDCVTVAAGAEGGATEGTGAGGTARMAKRAGGRVGVAAMMGFPSRSFVVVRARSV